MDTFVRNVVFAAAVAVACLTLAGCGGGVDGTTYQNANGMILVEFKSGGKAFTSLNGMTATCTYKQDSNKITMECEGDKTVFTLNDDGSLSGPPNGFLARLTKKKG
jgi:hypothetical protein